MSEDKISLTGDQMLEIRTRALTAALQTNSGTAVSAGGATGKILFDASAYLGFLINGQPSDEVPGSISAPQPNTPEVLAAAEPAKKRVTKASLSVVQTATTAQPAAAVAPAVTATASASPQSIPAPTTMQAAADSLKSLVQNDARGVAAGYENGRSAAVGILAKFGVTQLAQIPAPKLAEFKAALDAAGAAGSPITAADPTGGLL